jgi:diguanylate cyclase (GGDEF)-like protein
MTALAISGPIVWLMLSSLRHQRKLQDELLRLATTDVLTGLPNRRAFLEQVAPAGRFAQSGALVLADADHFKRINDTLGHDVGDLCLQALAARLTGLLAQGDVAARYGGEEFALFCPDATDDSLRGLETRLCHPVDVEIGDDGASVSVAMSAGAVLAERGASSIDAYRIADNALYEAKASGREKLVIATKVVHSPAAG